MMKNPSKTLISFIMAVMLLALACIAAGCAGNPKAPASSDNAASQIGHAAPKDSAYGVFLSYDGELSALSAYDCIVIDAQYHSAEEIADFKAGGHTVYSYINIGSLEDFRDYYADYADLALGNYEHWDEEVWVDVSARKWQDFILEQLAPSLASKGIDGFFVDNCDVYYCYPTAEILEGASKIMKGLRATGLKVIINGGDAFMTAYTSSGGAWSDVITGINQETVFSKINWDSDTFSAADADDREYFSEYIEKYAALGADIYLLEYTTDEKLKAAIRDYCHEHGFYYYIADSLELGI